MYRVQIGQIRNFTEEYLTSLYFLLKQAKDSNTNIGVFTYTLPIILILICFLESNINDIVNNFQKKSNLINADNYTKEFMQQICNDFIDISKTKFLEKYYIILKYYKNINIKSDNRYEKINIIRKVRNVLVHDKTYTIYKSKGDKDEIVKLLENYITPNNNLEEVIPDWLPYLEYNSICWMTKCVFEFYLWYMTLLFPEEEPRYKNKIERIISRHPLIKSLNCKKY